MQNHKRAPETKSHSGSQRCFSAMDKLDLDAHSTEESSECLHMVTNTHTALEGHAFPASNGFIKAGSRTLPGPFIPLDKFVLEPEEVTAFQKRCSVSIEELMQLLVAPASLLARSPTSDFAVGAIGLGVSGRLYVGVNLEFPGLPLQHSVHAEQFLIANAAWHGERGLLRIAVNAAPCGHCRQFIAELITAETIELAYKGHSYRLNDILVDKFCPSDLIEPGSAPLLLEQQRNDVHLSKGAEATLQQRPELREAAELALQSARDSYTPYTRCPAGMALLTQDGCVFNGGVIESCAYNPTINPLQAACITLAAKGKGPFSEITGAVLVEMQAGSVSFAETERVALRALNPVIQLIVLQLEGS
ncbi:hypothetical protein CVIRNUC_003831 [Coccomyxa viridis]|uniref:CMP/dCMP-type deaminase domain-containing protein n=1 Tax=Coccomyxa viridis TaxID=1274662 RepID=A0AAV1I1D1_9CHLO|nr:hypothetical protein CVIRNUC_003831 [Coccomyxa viridis]